MKKLLLLITILFMLPVSVLASEIRKDTIDVVINEDGTASVTETWEVPKQSDTYFVKDFFNIQGVEISNFKIVNKQETEYKEVDKLNKNNRKTFKVVNHDISKTLEIILDTYKDDVYTITYDVKGMIKHYKDDVYGLDFTFIGISYSMNIGNIYINIKGNVPYMETNTNLHGIGKELVVAFNEGAINVSTFTYDNRSVVRLLTRFVDIKYDNAVDVDMTFDEALGKAKSQNSYIMYVFNKMSKTFFIIVGAVLAVIIIFFVVLSLLKKNKKSNEFNGIYTINNKQLPKYDQVNYCINIPDYNIYKVGLLSSYFEIAKNRSDLVGAYILKWMFEGVIDAFPKDQKPFIRLNLETLTEGEQLDKDLYSILKESSNHNIIDGTRLERFASSHYLRVMTWFNMGASNVINADIGINNIKRVEKLGKMHLELQEGLLDEAEKLLGLKKYLLNFNQVPRDTELTESTYKYLLIYAELFGIGEQVAKEILRKNPDNAMARKLLDLEDVRFLYRNFYIKAYEPYKQIKKGDLLSDVSSVNNDADLVMQQSNAHNPVPTEQPTSKL